MPSFSVSTYLLEGAISVTKRSLQTDKESILSFETVDAIAMFRNRISSRVKRANDEEGTRIDGKIRGFPELDLFLLLMSKNLTLRNEPVCQDVIIDMGSMTYMYAYRN